MFRPDRLYLIIFIIVVASALILAGRQPVQNLKIPGLVTSPTPQTFLFVGDTGTGLKDQKNVAQAMSDYCSLENCEAAFIAGDVIYEEGVKDENDIQFKTKFEDIYQDILIPFYIVLGNHDYLGCEECYIKYSSKSSLWNFPGRYYTKEFESVVFLVIDTEKFDQVQRDWLQSELKKYSNKTKVVVGHRPIESYEVTKQGENWNGKSQLKEMVCNQADYYISGHAHVFEYLGRPDGCSVELLVVGTGGASLRESASPYPGLFTAKNYGFLSFEVLPDKVAWRFISDSGEVLFSK